MLFLSKKGQRTRVRRRQRKQISNLRISSKEVLMPVKKLNFKKYVVIALAIIVSITGSYIYGTFKPNNWVTQKLQIEAETKHAMWAKDLGLHAPSMNYKTNVQFVS